MRSYLLAWRRVPVVQRGMIVVLATAVLLANVRQPYPDIAPLQHVPTVLLLVASPILLVRFPLSDRSIAALTGFFLLHTLAGRYTYSNVPYDAWARALVGRDISSVFHLRRNGFDRLVHLSFGLLWVGPFAEAVRRHAGIGWRASIVMAVLFVGAVSAAYEIFEWLLTMVLSPGAADDYNGQQGDAWDSQKDMASAIVGSVAAALWAFRRGAIVKLRKPPPPSAEMRPPDG